MTEWEFDALQKVTDNREVLPAELVALSELRLITFDLEASRHVLTELGRFTLGMRGEE